ncbi:helix-turn-helix domain-containing protein [Aeromicrobium sp. CnD17-E]|uniref:helix-turn-helix domain-containing protein n=1 Tax=Aeromicrobium sp. CnD17-E TaxID=2954487 RepID=UPI00209777CE|nr:helix-turn-helix domain-containing protein [Aeromicrobium sp. CnD17-E]MCO7238412.1 helix-turn-helix domain-containing protein [Aeromicrobium sp. CnD17-E]
MARTPKSVDELAHLVEEFGAERHLADRVTALRQSRGWSQDRLAAEMAAAGCPIPQSAISRIENATARRDITVDEAISFAKVFGVPLIELLLPPGAQGSVLLLQLLRHGGHVAQQLRASQQAYADAVERVAELLLEDSMHYAAFDIARADERITFEGNEEISKLGFMDEVEARYRALGGTA